MPGPSSMTRTKAWSASFAAGDVNCAAARRVTQRVVEDVGDCAFEAVAIDGHRGACVNRHLELDATLVGCELERRGRVDDRRREVCGFQPGSLVDVRPHVVEQAGDEPIDLLGLRPRSVEPLMGVADACRDCVEVAAQREEWGAEVMGDGADEKASFSLESRVVLGCLLEPRGHACDGGGDVLDFPDRRGGGGLERVAAGDRVDLGIQAAKWGDEPAACRPDQQHRTGEQGGQPRCERDEHRSRTVNRGSEKVEREGFSRPSGDREQVGRCRPGGARARCGRDRDIAADRRADGVVAATRPLLA